MRVIADFHIHSKYARATSPNMDLENIAVSMARKGIGLMATGDYLHPKWLAEIKSKTREENGLLDLNGKKFILSTEVCLVFENPEVPAKSVKMHVLVLTDSLRSAEMIADVVSKRGSLDTDGRPLLMMSGSELIDFVSSVDSHAVFIPAHIWTPWFSLFGSKFGVSDIKSAFPDKREKIVAMETGLSSDPEMNWSVSALDPFALVSNSDAHSPEKIGREANVFELETLSFGAIMNALRTREGFAKTYEFYPQEGKYFNDGHRDCGVNLTPEQSEEMGNICPVCKRRMTLGVLHRVFQLADRKKGEKPAKTVPFQHIIPLPAIIAKALGKTENTKAVHETYERLIAYFGSEFSVFEAQERDLRLAMDGAIADAILAVNRGNVFWNPGHDGVFGEFSFGEAKKPTKMRTLNDF
jgi:uncharacterized protein (TIGR00375 family)